MSVTYRHGMGWDAVAPAIRGPVPILGLRGLRYEAEGRPGLLPPVAGLRIAAHGLPGARPVFDPLSGQALFDDLPPGPRRFIVTDPENRFFPAAVEVDIPARYATRPTRGGGTPAGGEPPRQAVLLRPHPARAVPPGRTALIGRVHDAQGRAVPLARITLATTVEGRPALVVGFAGADGAFVLLLPGQSSAAAPVPRRLAVARPVAPLAALLQADFLAGLPAGPDGTPPASLFEDVRATPIAPDGSPCPAPPGQVLIRPARTTRRDLLLGG